VWSIVGSSAVDRGFECGISWVRVRYIVGSSAVNRGFEPRSDLTKDYETGICSFSAAVRRKSKDWLTRNRDNVSDWGDMYIHGLLFR
jgi:hypothetical protein